jgi:hypothetical protein
MNPNGSLGPLPPCRRSMIGPLLVLGGLLGLAGVLLAGPR